MTKANDVYDLFYELKDDKYVCLIPGCSRTFKTYGKYIEHFKYNYAHEYYIHRKLEYYEEPRVSDDNVVIDPIEKKLIEMNVKYDNKFINLKSGANVTYLLEDKLDFAVRENKIVVAFIAGLQGAGKSMFGLTLADIILDKEEDMRGYRPKMHIGFERNDTLTMVKDAKSGDVIIQDEVPIGAGFGDKTEANRLRNILLVLRKKHIHFIFISPKKVDIPGMQFAVEVISYNKKTRVSQGVLYTKDFQAIGYVYVQILDADNNIISEYEKDKDKFVDKIQLSGGSDVNILNEDEFDEDVELILDIVKKKDPTMSRARIEKEVALNIGQNTKYQSWIAAEVKSRLKLEDLIYQTEMDIGSGGIGDLTMTWEQTDTIRDNDIGLEICKYSKPKTLHQKLGYKWFKYYFCDKDAKGDQTKDIINEENNVDYTKQAYYSIFLPKFIESEDCFGKAVEKAIRNKYYKKYKIDGRIGQPDLIGTDDYIEVKARKYGTTRKVSDYFDASSYIWKYLQDGKDVKLVELVYDRNNKFTVNIYKLGIDNKSDDEP